MWVFDESALLGPGGEPQPGVLEALLWLQRRGMVAGYRGSPALPGVLAGYGFPDRPLGARGSVLVRGDGGRLVLEGEGFRLEASSWPALLAFLATLPLDARARPDPLGYLGRDGRRKRGGVV